jgi:hypothetical protein
MIAVLQSIELCCFLPLAIKPAAASCKLKPDSQDLTVNQHHQAWAHKSAYTLEIVPITSTNSASSHHHHQGHVALDRQPATADGAADAQGRIQDSTTPLMIWIQDTEVLRTF